MTKDFDSIKFKSDKSVYGMMWDMMWGEYRWLSLVVVVILIGLAVIPVMISPVPIPFFLVFAFMVAVFYVSYIRSKARGQFMKNFAKTNGLEYQKSASLDSVSGKLFDMGHSKSIDHVVRGNFDGHPIRLFSYRYTVGSGKHKKTYHFTVWEITFEKTEFPHILLQSRSMKKFARSESDEEEINLESEFADKYRLFASRGYGTEVLQIFTSELLRMLCEKASNFSIEFADKSMYIYDDVLINNNKKLREIYEVAREVFDSTGPLINRLHDDLADMHRYFK